MKFWLAVASREHVRRGIDGGFCQLCHGSAEPLERMSVGDWIIYYSSKQAMDAPGPCQQFTAIGEVMGDVYENSMGGFISYRREVLYLFAKCIDIRPLLGQLSFIRDGAHWGSAFRFGHFEIPHGDFELIATNMTAMDPSVAISSYGKSRDLWAVTA